MRFIKHIKEIRDSDLNLVGGKTLALAKLERFKTTIPPTYVLTTDAYNYYVSHTGIKERICMELSRKMFKNMRWEELWDAALRIRNMFLCKKMPAILIDDIRKLYNSSSFEKPLVVRSSSPSEDAEGSSFAGLHESYINITDFEQLCKNIRLVWASLWSDSALMYRQELKLDFNKSSMAVVIQQLIDSQRSGIVFTKNPNNPEDAVIEAVYGLNQGLVDGVIEPDRWLVSRRNSEIHNRFVAEHKECLLPEKGAVVKKSISRQEPVLKDGDVLHVYKSALKLEGEFGSPQDVEWTFDSNRFYVLQARPITTLKHNEHDQRTWYMSLKRSFDNLIELKDKIESTIIPGMDEAARRLEQDCVANMTQDELGVELQKRTDIFKEWEAVYWDDLIPFAHGIRLFGQIYNDMLSPENPYEFIDLLKNQTLISTERNKLLQELADYVNNNDDLKKKIISNEYQNTDAAFDGLYTSFVDKYGDTVKSVTETGDSQEIDKIIYNIISQHSNKKFDENNADIEVKEQEFINAFADTEKEYARKLLELGRSSYQMRDNDNIYLGNIKAQVIAVIDMLKQKQLSAEQQELLSKHQMRLNERNHSQHVSTEKKPVALKARQLIGQPAGPGCITGKARVINSKVDLKDLKTGEVLVCDAIEPNMTFLVPLAAGIVERRGGMLIHGAIIAREYGIPCVTGIPGATQWIKTGDQITVDGHLGIVTIGETYKEDTK